MKKFIVSIISFIMICSYIYPYNHIEANEEFKISFQKAYATINDTIQLEISGADVDDCEIEWSIDSDVLLKNETRFPVKEEYLQELIKVEVQYQNQTLSKQMLISDLPVIYIDIENQQEVESKDIYLNADIVMSGNKAYPESIYYEGTTEIKGRGNSTWELPKKPYRLKLAEKASLYGMNANKHWNLIANYLDESLLRNQIAYELSDGFGLYSVKSTLVDVVLNGRKIGNYQLCEHIRVDENRVDILDYEAIAEDIAKAYGNQNGFSKELRKELENKMIQNLNWITTGVFEFCPNDWMLDSYRIQISDYYKLLNINGGYLIELDDTMDELTKFYSSLNQPIMVKSPEYLYTNETMLNNVKAYIDHFESSIQNTEDFSVNIDKQKYHYSDLYDMDSLVKYFLVQEIFFNYDSMKRSTYMYKDVDEKMMMGPVWDMDYSSGNDHVFEYYDRWETLYFNYDTQAKSWYKCLIKDPYFVTKLRESYWCYRDELENIIKTDGSIDAYERYLMTSAKENATLWHDSDSFSRNVKVFKDWMIDRIEWLDAQFDSQSSIMSSFQLANYNDEFVNLKQVNESKEADVSTNEYDDILLPMDYDLKCIFNDNDFYQLFINEDCYGDVADGQIVSHETIFEEHDKVVLTFKSSNGKVCSYVVQEDKEFIEEDNIPPMPVADIYVQDISYTSATLQWKPSPSDDVVRYELVQYPDRNVVANINESTYILEGLNEDTTYTYGIYAIDAAGNKSLIRTISFTTLKVIFVPETVKEISATQLNYKTIRLSWSESKNAAYYDVYRKGSNTNSVFEMIQRIYTPYTTISSLTTGKDYSFFVVARNEDASSQPSPIIVYQTKLDGEVQLAIEKISNTKFKLTWNQIDGATRYIIYRKRNKDAYRKVLTLGKDDLSYTTSEMPEGEYAYIVKAGRYDSKDRVMTESSNEVKGTSVYDEINLELSLRNQVVQASWNKIEGVTYYEIYRSTSRNGTYTKLKTTKDTIYTSKKLSKRKTYYFKVRGYKSYNNEKVYTKDSLIKSVVVK